MSDQVKTVKYYLDYHAKNNPDKIFVICPHTKKQISFLEFKQNIEKLAAYFKEQNLKKGDAVCTVIENSISSIYLMLGIMYAGMVQKGITQCLCLFRIVTVRQRTGESAHPNPKPKKL